MPVSAGICGCSSEVSARQFSRDVLGVARDLLQISNQLGGAPGGKSVPDTGGLLVVVGKDVAQEPVAGGGQHDAVSPPVGGDLPARHQPPLLQPVHPSRYI